MPGPINRKKNVTGKAGDDSMKTQGPGLGQGPVGAKDGYQERKEQQRPAQKAAGPFARPGGTQQGASNPFQRPTGAQHTSSPFGSRPAQNNAQQRPMASRPAQGGGQGVPPVSPRPSQSSGNGTQRSGGTRGGGGMKLIIIVIVVLLLGGGGGLSGLFGGGGGGNTNTGTTTTTSGGLGDLVGGLLGGGSDSGSGLGSLLGGGLSSLLGGGGSSAGSGVDLSSVLGGSWFSGQSGIGGTASSGASPVYSSGGGGANYTAVDRSVASGSRARYTTLKGGGKDTVTVLVYMCGADLESKSAMATKDLQEMLAANFGGKAKPVIYTGGSTGWRNNMVSSKVNQIWQIENGGMKCLQDNAGAGAMTDPETLASFIQYGKKNFKSNRNILILWDHGSGSVAGYGYDERNPKAGSMSLAGLNSAFKKGGLKFDFIGFDTCLMATVENALMASNYADYLIASEETEPGIGWYYTDWLTALGSNTSMSTLDIGKQICDDFVSRCAKECRGQQTTLSLIDLAELSHTVPEKLNGFADSVTAMITNQEYKTVSNARNGSREFATSARIDQVDLTDLCNNLGTAESTALAKTLHGAVKYNRTNISDAYGLSVYFPYKRVSNVDKAVSTYAAIGMDDSYSKAIRAFASVEASGQAVTGGATSAMPSLFGSSSGGGASGDLIGSLLSSFLGGGSGGMDFLSGRTLTDEQMGQYLAANLLDSSKLFFQQYNGQYVIDLPAEQWALVHGIDLNMFYDNGEGYVDLGLDNLFEIDSKTGLMIADTSGTWMALNGQPVPYYHETTEYASDTDWRITGRVPCLLNGDRADLLLVFDAEHETGYVAGARSVYDGDIEAVAKNMTEIKDGDEIVFLCDLYDYQQNYKDSYRFGKPVTVQGALTVSDVILPDASKILATYRFTDIYNQAYWTPVIGR